MKGARQLAATSMPSSSANSRISAASGVSPVIDLAAGKFPQPGHRLALRALGEQHPAVGVDKDHRGDKDQRRRRLSCGSCH